jgi:hypothetical protein
MSIFYTKFASTKKYFTTTKYQYNEQTENDQLSLGDLRDALFRDNNQLS